MSSTSFGSGSSQSTSSSEPTVVRTPENDILDALSQYASQLAGQMNGWAQNTFANTSGVTNQAVQNFFDTSQKMSDFSQGLTDQYNNLFAPENRQLIQDANTYASEPRMRANMGMAGATQAQAGDAALKNTEQKLLSYDIDPSAGRYRGLDEAAKVQNAANVAGAMNTQRNNDIATGQKLRSEAVQVGSLLPSAVTNARNTAIQANTGASNASLANANTGANLMSLADKYLQTAMGLKLPLMGQNSRSQGSSFNSQGSNSQDPSHPSGGGGGGNGGGNGGGSAYGPGGPAWMPTHGGGSDMPGGIYSAKQLGPGAKITDVYDPEEFGRTKSGESWVNPETGLPRVLDGTDWDQWLNPGGNPPGGGQWGGDNGFPGVTTGTGYIDNPTGPSTDWVGKNPFSDMGFGQTYDYGGNTNTWSGGDMNLPDMGGATDQSGWGAYDYNSQANQPSMDMSGWGDYSSAPAPQDTNWGAYDPSGYSDNGGYADYAYASGGPVPPSASPSGGAMVDDVPAQMPGGAPAQLNANEFVIPQDVANWKGQEFFHKLIAQSRQNATQMRAQSGATPKMRR